MKILLSETKFDMLDITETKLSSRTADEKLNIDGYKFVRRDRVKEDGCGGCLLYYNEHMDVDESPDLFSSELPNSEAIWTELTMHSQKLLVSVLYRPPKQTTFFENFEKQLEQIWGKRKNILTVGDLNADLLFKGKSKADTLEGRNLLQKLNQYKLSNVIKEPTRITNTTRTLLDLVITSDRNKISKAGTHETGTADHRLVYAVIKLTKTRIPPKTRTVVDWNKCDLNKFKETIEQVPWHICSVFEDVDDNYWIMEKLYKDVAKDFLPTRTVKVKTNSLPWVDGNIRKLMNQRYRKLQKAQRTKDPKDREEYIKLRNKVNIELRKAESLYWKRLLEEKENGSKDFWKIVKKMTGRENKVKRIGPIQNEMEELIYDDTEKAETMNRCFSSVGKQLASKFPTDPMTETELPTYIRETSKIENIPLDNSLFQKKFSKINICKSHGHDNITAKEMKMVGDEFHTAIGMISRISFESKTYPSQRKVGKVQTVHKKGRKITVAITGH